MTPNRRWFSVSLSGLSIGWLSLVSAFLPLFGIYGGLTIYSAEVSFSEASMAGQFVYSMTGFFAGLAGTGFLALLFEIHEDLAAIRGSRANMPTDITIRGQNS